MEQGIGRNETPLISNIDSVTESTGYLFTRNENNEIVATEAPEPIISNIDDVTSEAKYVITRNEDDKVIVEEESAEIQNLDDVQNNERYHITRREGNILAVLDSSLQLSNSNLSESLIFGIRKSGNNYFITRVPALIEFIFETDDLQFGNSFNVLGSGLSRAVHVCTLTGKLVKLGFVHVNLADGRGLIDRQYRFILRVNDRNTRSLTIAANSGAGSNRSRTTDTEAFNIFFNGGDIIGLGYENIRNSNTGNYCQVKLTVDTNARQERFGQFHLP